MTSQIDISISPEAYTKAIELRDNNKEYQAKSLGLYLDGKGCDGFTTAVSFDEKSKDDLQLQIEDLELIIDEETYYFCAGSTIKWLVHEELGEETAMITLNTENSVVNSTKKKLSICL